MVNLLVADDHTVLRQALCELLEKKEGFKVIAQASNGEEVLKLLQKEQPDLIIMDIAMPELDGIEALRKMKAKGDSPPVLILTANAGEMTVRAALDAGAKGFIPKDVGEEELQFAIKSVLKGQTYLSPSITDKMIGKDSRGSNYPNPLSVLTK
ncbi:MAG: DNA-binding response regulator, partial [Candidatus Dadabacteria bacterium]